MQAVLAEQPAELSLRAPDDDRNPGLRVRNGVFSSQKIEKPLDKDVVFRMLATDNVPSLRTIYEFPRWHIENVKCLFVQVMRPESWLDTVARWTIRPIHAEVISRTIVPLFRVPSILAGINYLP